jgi:drug/metabolite transporter (DMT)-like permease|tara:strand:+ start:246 stop:1163 length:918 start_codon:yes stop_codon:yes gene_type:complete
LINNSSINSVTDRKFLGYVAALVTVTIWAAFLVGTRFAVTKNFTVEEILVLRLIPAAIIMLPYMVKLGVMPPGNRLITKIIFALGASALFPWVLSMGLYYSPASNAGALGPGTLPFWTALIAFLITSEKPNRSRKFGLFVILLGALVIGIVQFETNYGDLTWLGNILFLLGAALWAIYSVIFRQSGIAPLHGLVIGLFWGSLIFVPFLITFGSVKFENTTLHDIAFMVILHSFIIGILAMLLFTYAVKKLGAVQTAAFGALTPILALIGGVILLDEIISPSKLSGICLVTAGVLLASGALSFTKK